VQDDGGGHVAVGDAVRGDDAAEEGQVEGGHDEGFEAAVEGAVD
jgi:hypothetical protein